MEKESQPRSDTCRGAIAWNPGSRKGLTFPPGAWVPGYRGADCVTSIIEIEDDLHFHFVFRCPRSKKTTHVESKV